MKKYISIFLCIIMMLSLTSVAFAKEEPTPVVFVPGYTSSRMFISRGTENEKRIWRVDIADKVIEALKKEIPSVLISTGKVAEGNYNELFETLDPYAKEITDYLTINDDGSSKYDVEVYPHSVETTRVDKLEQYGYYPDADTIKMLKKYTNSKNIYCCTLDWRLGQVDNASILNEYIDDVLEATGANKVSIIGVSFGGQVTASYLSLYGGDKVKNAVLHCPALDGSSIIPQLFSGEDIEISWSDSLKLLQTFRYEETDYSPITDIYNPDFLNGFIRAFIDYYLLDLFLNFGSAWDLVPLNQYVELRDKLINDGNHQSLVEKSDKYHFEIAANRQKDLKRLQSEGVNISIVAGYGYNLVVNNKMNSDSVIEVNSTTGAKCAEIGSTLAANYIKGVCENAGHCHISPNGCIDASVGYLPENTWYVEDMFHALGTNEKAVSQLLCDLLFSENGFDVHDNVKYPQFMVSDNAFKGVICSFSSCSQGYFTPYSTEMTITNLSKDSNIVIDEISAVGVNLKFGYSVEKVLSPGESMTVSVYGKVPSADLKTFKIEVGYVKQGEKLNTVETRTQFFRFTNGSLLSEVLEAGTDELSPTLKDENVTVEGKLNNEIIFARIGYFLKKMLTYVSALVNGIINR